MTVGPSHDSLLANSTTGAGRPNASGGDRIGLGFLWPGTYNAQRKTDDGPDPGRVAKGFKKT